MNLMTRYIGSLILAASLMALGAPEALGQTNSGIYSIYSTPQIDGNRFEVDRDSMALSYTGTHAAFVMQQRDAEDLPGANFPTSTITSGSYNAATGVVTLAIAGRSYVNVGNFFNVSGVTGTGSFAFVDVNALLAQSGTTSAVGGSTLIYTIQPGLSLTITGGTVSSGATNIVQGAVFQFNATGEGVVNATNHSSSSIWQGLTSTMTKTNDGSGQAFTAICQVGSNSGVSGYNECGGFEGSLSNGGNGTFSSSANLSFAEGIVQDGTSTASSGATEMTDYVGRMAKWNTLTLPANNIVVTSEENQPINNILNVLPDGNLFSTWQAGINLTQAIFTSGSAIALPNNTSISFDNSSGTIATAYGVTATNITYMQPVSATGEACLTNLSAVRVFCQVANNAVAFTHLDFTGTAPSVSSGVTLVGNDNVGRVTRAVRLRLR